MLALFFVSHQYVDKLTAIFFLSKFSLIFWGKIKIYSAVMFLFLSAITNGNLNVQFDDSAKSVIKPWNTFFFIKYDKNGEVEVHHRRTRN